MTNERLIQLEQKRKAITIATEPNIVYSRPKFFKGLWTKEEDATIVEMQALYGNKWAKILPFLPGRSKRSIRNRCFVIKSAKESKTVKAKVTVSKPSPAPKLISVEEEKHYSYLMIPTTASQTASNSKVEDTKPLDMPSKVKVNSLCEKVKKETATVESCLAFKHTSQKSENAQHQRLNKMNEPNSKASSNVSRGLTSKHIENNAVAIETLNNEVITASKEYIEVANHIVRSHSEDLESLFHSTRRVYESEGDILAERSGDKIPYCSNDATSKTIRCGEVGDIPPDLYSPFHSTRRVYKSEQNILAERPGDKIPYCSNDATSKTIWCEEIRDVPPEFDAESFAHAITYASSLING